jgi:RNA polymerase sigma-70 factor (ECF subfamily)
MWFGSRSGALERSALTAAGPATVSVSGSVSSTESRSAIGIGALNEDAAKRARFERLVTDHYGFVWRNLRRLGVREADLEDAVQEVFLLAARNLDEIEREYGYLFKTCIFVAAHARRTVERRREISDDDTLNEQVDERMLPDETIEANEARIRLQRVLDRMPEDLRVPFMLYEIEHFTMSEIGDTLNLPMGTVASRLRRGRELFMTLASRASRASRASEANPPGAKR